MERQPSAGSCSTSNLGKPSADLVRARKVCGIEVEVLSSDFESIATIVFCDLESGLVANVIANHDRCALQKLRGLEKREQR